MERIRASPHSWPFKEDLPTCPVDPVNTAHPLFLLLAQLFSFFNLIYYTLFYILSLLFIYLCLFIIIHPYLSLFFQYFDYYNHFLYKRNMKKL